MTDTLKMQQLTDNMLAHLESSKDEIRAYTSALAADFIEEVACMHVPVLYDNLAYVLANSTHEFTDSGVFKEIGIVIEDALMKRAEQWYSEMLDNVSVVEVE